jgi:DNA-binding FadR family transcriptional regulator
MALQALRLEDDGRSRVEAAADGLALAIVTGTYRPGERLPSVRRLARSLGINASTVQVVLARLASLGFVEAQRGIGFLVRDVERDGGIETWGYVFRFAAHLPERAVKVYADLLALRRTLVLDALETIAEEPACFRSTETRRVVERLALAVARESDAPGVLARLEMDAFRELTLALGRSAFTAVLNSVGEIYLSEPRAVRAMYANPSLHVAMWTLLLDEWDAERLDVAAVERVREWLEGFDRDVVERYALEVGVARGGMK